LKVLKKIKGQLEKTDIIWAVTGSTAFALRGLPFDPEDIDIQTDKKGAYRMEEVLSEYVVEEVEFSSSDKIRSHFGTLEISGIKVEIMGDLQKKVKGSWEPPIDIKSHREFLKIENLKIPVLDLEYELRAYQKLGRDNTVKKLQEWIDKA